MGGVVDKLGTRGRFLDGLVPISQGRVRPWSCVKLSKSTAGLTAYNILAGQLGPLYLYDEHSCAFRAVANFFFVFFPIGGGNGPQSTTLELARLV